MVNPNSEWRPPEAEEPIAAEESIAAEKPRTPEGEPYQPADAPAAVEEAPAPTAEEGWYGEAYDPAPAPAPRAVVTIGRGLFFTAAAVAVLLIVGLAGATTYLLVDRNGGPDDPIVATVNGEPIRRSEYDRAVAENNGSQVLDGLVLERLVEAEARKRGIAVDDARTSQLVDDTKKNFNSDDEYQAALAQAGLTEQDLRKRVRINEIMRQMVADDTTVTDQEVNDQYEASKDRFAGQTPEQAKEQVKTTLQRQKADSAIPALLDKLKSDAKIETHVPGDKS